MTTTKMLNACIVTTYGHNLRKGGIDVHDAIAGHTVHVQG
jgi:hypothetical protein